MNALRIALVLTLGFLFSLAVWAQADGCDPTSQKLTEECKALYDPQSPSGDTEGAVLSDESVVTVAIGEDKETASIQFVKPWLGHKLAVTVSAPVDKNTGSAEFLGVTGINDAASMKLEYNYINWPEFGGYERYEHTAKGTFGGGQELHNEQETDLLLCNKTIRRFAERRAGAQAGAAWSEDLEQLHAKVKKLDLPTEDEIKDNFDAFVPGKAPANRSAEEAKADVKVAKLLEQLEDEDEGLCNAVSQALRKLSAADLYTLELATRYELTSRRRVSFFGVNGTVGQEEFKFLDRGPLEADGTIEETSDREVPWSLGVRAGWIFLSRSTQSQGEESLTFSINTERGYKAADNVDLCKPVDGFETVTDIESCKEIPLGAPSATDSLRFVIEYRALGKKMGLAARGFYLDSDDKPDDYGFEVPLFFLPNKDGKFQGGLTIGWSDQSEDDVKIAVFVGRTFGIF